MLTVLVTSSDLVYWNGLPQFVWEAITNKTIFATSRKRSKPDSVTICPGTGTGLIDTLQKISCQQLDLLDAWAKDGHQRISKCVLSLLVLYHFNLFWPRTVNKN